jgi:hypothetical protein
MDCEMDLKQIELCCGSQMELRWVRGQSPWSLSNIRDRRVLRFARQVRRELIRKLNDKFRSAGVSFNLGLGLVLLQGRWRSQLICRITEGTVTEWFCIHSVNEPAIPCERVSERKYKPINN